jgi:hypothetical protein
LDSLRFVIWSSVSARGEGAPDPPFMMQGGLAPFTLQSNVLELPLFSLNWNSLCKIIKII